MDSMFFYIKVLGNNLYTAPKFRTNDLKVIKVSHNKYFHTYVKTCSKLPSVCESFHILMYAYLCDLANAIYSLPGRAVLFVFICGVSL
ncbi:hypothetical protein XENTR_v10016215 [Xenopus tropicalis]|nr:hypothetical protein XENTR_v10016215 [Xenopus tropicalis]